MTNLLEDAFRGCSGAFVDGFKSRARSITEMCEQLESISSRMSAEANRLQDELHRREQEWADADREMQEMIQGMKSHFEETQRQCEQQMIEFREQSARGSIKDRKYERKDDAE